MLLNVHGGPSIFKVKFYNFGFLDHVIYFYKFWRFKVLTSDTISISKKSLLWQLIWIFLNDSMTFGPLYSIQSAYKPTSIVSTHKRCPLNLIIAAKKLMMVQDTSMAVLEVTYQTILSNVKQY